MPRRFFILVDNVLQVTYIFKKIVPSFYVMSSETTDSQFIESTCNEFQFSRRSCAITSSNINTFCLQE